MKVFKFPDSVTLFDLTTGERAKDENGEVVPPISFKRIALRALCNPENVTDYLSMAMITKLITRVSAGSPGDDFWLDDAAHKAFCDAWDRDIAAKADPLMGAAQLFVFVRAVKEAKDADPAGRPANVAETALAAV